MQTKTANSYTFSRDFADGAPRIRARDLAERVRAEPKAFASVVAIRANDFADSGKTPPIIEQDGETWLTEAQCYALLWCLGHTKGLDKRLRKISCKALIESIQAFVDERRVPGSQTCKMINGTVAYERVTPGINSIAREDGEGGYDLNEVGAIYILLRGAHDPNPEMRPGVSIAEGLNRTRDFFERGHAQLRRNNLTVVPGGKDA